MNEEEKILALFEEYFATASEEELEADVRAINAKLGNAGISLEVYLETLNDATAYSLVETGLCDDIAYADFFNSSINDIEMGNLNDVTVLDSFVRIAFHSSYGKEQLENAGESNYAMAA